MEREIISPPSPDTFLTPHFKYFSCTCLLHQYLQLFIIFFSPKFKIFFKSNLRLHFFHIQTFFFNGSNIISRTQFCHLQYNFVRVLDVSIFFAFFQTQLVHSNLYSYTKNCAFRPVPVLATDCTVAHWSGILHSQPNQYFLSYIIAPISLRTCNIFNSALFITYVKGTHQLARFLIFFIAEYSKFA